MSRSFLHILSITPSEHRQSHNDLWVDIWRETALVRFRCAPSETPIMQSDLDWGDIILVDCSDKRAAYEVLAQTSISRKRFFLVSFAEPTGGKLAAKDGSLEIFSAEDIRAQWRKFFAFDSFHDRVPEIKWGPSKRGGKGQTRLQSELDTALVIAIRTYFPEHEATFHIESVSGGLSGTPLLRVSTGTDCYFLKFFDQEGEFIREWEKHVLAKGWLGEHTVDLIAVPELPTSGIEQVVAFRKGAQQPTISTRYPICFRSAEVTATLKSLYRRSSSTFSIMAYTQVVEALASNQPLKGLRYLPLWELCASAPGAHSSAESTSILDLMRSSEFLEEIGDAIEELTRYARVNCSEFDADLTNLQELLYGLNPEWLMRPASVVFGRVHGDANSRNCLFDGTQSQPSGLKIIDCGSYEEQAPLIFDLAQMESDLKIALMATEKTANFGDIDTMSLADWWKQELAFLRDPFDIRLVADDEPTRRAYGSIESIRAKAREYSGQPPDPRGYLFCLLYWTLRKLRRKDIPHAKRILALRSTARIAAQLREWNSM